MTQPPSFVSVIDHFIPYQYELNARCLWHTQTVCRSD